jgi:hypothetical protein
LTGLPQPRTGRQLRDLVELLGRHQHPRGSRAEDRRGDWIDGVWANDDLVGTKEAFCSG